METKSPKVGTFTNPPSYHPFFQQVFPPILAFVGPTKGPIESSEAPGGRSCATAGHLVECTVAENPSVNG